MGPAPRRGRPQDEGHRGHAAPDQRYGAPPRYHAVRRARPRERHQDPPEGRRCPRHGQEVSTPGAATVTVNTLDLLLAPPAAPRDFALNAVYVGEPAAYNSEEDSSC